MVGVDVLVLRHAWAYQSLECDCFDVFGFVVELENSLGQCRCACFETCARVVHAMSVSGMNRFQCVFDGCVRVVRARPVSFKIAPITPNP